MYEILIGLGIISLVTFVLLLFIDKELQFLSRIGIDKTRFVKIKKIKIFIPRIMRKDGQTSIFSLYALGSYYLINFTGLLLLIIHFVTGSQIVYWIGVSILFLNLFVLFGSILKISLNREQQKIKDNIRNKK
jgi:hypothetical protein